MNQNKLTLNFEDALNAIGNIAESFTVETWIPSKQKNYSFKEIDAKQQKKMLSSAVNSSVYNTNFIKNFYEIVKTNAINEQDREDVDNFTIFDKFSIAVSLKSKISNEIKVVFDEKQDISQKIDVNEIISRFKGLEIPKNENVSVQQGENTINIELSIPTLKKEYDYEEQVHKKEKKIDDIKSNIDIQIIVAEAFVGEISKYIEKIVINDIDLQFNDFDFNKKIKIVEKLPSGIVQKILEIVSKWKTLIDDVLTVKIKVDEVEYKKLINIDSVLFLS
jgi:hypothetical protein